MKVYVIKDQFQKPLYYVDGPEWTYDIDAAQWFMDIDMALLVAKTAPYRDGVVVPHEVETFG